MTDRRNLEAYRGSSDRPRRVAHPARSARILSTGLAATATFGLISGYAYAAHSTTNTTNTGTNDGLAPVTPTAPVDGTANGAETPSVGVQSQSQSSPTPQAPASVQPSPVVIEVPAPAPAAPASGGGSGSGQSSSGSR